MLMKMKKRKGFTLIELIIVIAIIGILAAVAIPRYIIIRDTSTVKADASTAAQIISAARIQETEEGTTVANLAALKTNYMPAATPQSGGTYALTGGGSANYVVTFTPAAGHYKDEVQTVTEGSKFVINEPGA